MQSTDHKCYTARFQRSVVKSVCSAQTKCFAQLKDDVLGGYWNMSEVQTCV